jgi:hypothetical protein
MSSHWEWAKKVVALHDQDRPFAPENGVPLRFKIGDPVIFTNVYGVRFRLRITGFFQRSAEPCAMYATGYRYLVDSSSPWFPVKEEHLQLDEDNRDDLNGVVGTHAWSIGIDSDAGYPVIVDDCHVAYCPTQAIAKACALEVINRIHADSDCRLVDRPAGGRPSPVATAGVFRTFKSAQEARDYRHNHGTGGWIFVPDDGAEASLFPPHMSPTAIIHHDLTTGRSGPLLAN